MPGAPDEPFHLFVGATAPLTPPPGVDPSAHPYPGKIPPLPDYNTLFTERIAITDTYLNLRELSPADRFLV